MDGRELKELILYSNQIFQALGGSKGPAEEEAITINFAFSSVAALRDIGPGEELTLENIFPIRPAGGAFGPSEYPNLLGMKASRKIESRTQITHEDLTSN
jgi:N-acetylneuraminate synthase